MNKDFARKLIEQPGEATTAQLFNGRIEGVFWVDWREADDRMVELAAACIPGSDMAPEWIDGKLHIRFRGQRTLVPLQFKPGEQDITLLALNRAIAPALEIRWIRASDGGDTLAFFVLERADWAALEAAHGGKVDQAFGRIEAGSALFAQDEAPPPPAAPARGKQAQARVQEGRDLAAQGKRDAAIAVFDDVVKRFGEDNDEYQDKDAGFYVLMARVSKGLALYDTKKLPEAAAAFEDAIRRHEKNRDRASRDLLGMAHANRCLCLKELRRYPEQVAAAEEYAARFGEDTGQEIRLSVANAVVNAAFSLGLINKRAEQVQAYDRFVQRYEADTSPDMAALVTLALNGGGYNRMMLAKQNWSDTESRKALLRHAIPDLRRALAICTENRKVMILGNLGYALFLNGDEMASVRETQECLRLGGKAALDGQRSDAAEHRLAKEDAAYEDMLQRLWKKLNPA